MTTAPLPRATGQWEDEFNSRDPNAKGQPKSFEIPAEHFKELFPHGAEFPGLEDRGLIQTSAVHGGAVRDRLIFGSQSRRRGIKKTKCSRCRIRFRAARCRWSLGR